MKKIYILIIGLLVLGLIPNVSAFDQIYYAVGDSLARGTSPGSPGYDLDPDGSDQFVMQMSNRYNLGAPASHNFAETSYSSLWGVQHMVEYPQGNITPKYTFVTIGINDRRLDPSYTANQTADNLKTMYDYYNSKGSTAWVLIEPMNGTSQTGWSTEASQRDNTTKIETRLKEFNVRFLKIYDAIDTTPGDGILQISNVSYAPDYLHPNKLGNSLIADYIWNETGLSPSNATFHTGNVLYLTMNGINGSTIFTDLSPSSNTVTAIADAQVTTLSPKFGSGALLLDGREMWGTYGIHRRICE